MKIPYYPGCTLKTKAKNFEESALVAAQLLGVELEELPTWHCCGTFSSLAADDLIHYVAPLRNLIQVRELGERRLLTLCSVCYNTLKRANRFLKRDELTHRTLNTFLETTEPYEGDVQVVHLLEIIAEKGWEDLRGRVRRPLQGLRVAPYYGCMLLRPQGVGLDDVERPSVMEEMFRALGAEPVITPWRNECCGAFHTVEREEMVRERASLIARGAAARGAEVLAVSCPLCAYNLEYGQEILPVLYFAQLLALALGAEGDLGWEYHRVDPRPLLEEKGLLPG